MKTKKCSKCDRLAFSKGLCTTHQKKKPIKTKPKVINQGRIDYNTEDFDKLSISDLKRVADYWLRQYLLSNAMRLSSGYIVCPIKNKGFPESKIHVAHFIDRNVMGLRYDLDNCHLISEQSNMWDAQIPKEGYKSLHHYDYENYLGADLVRDIRERSKEIVILNRQDYIDIINKFKNG